MMNIKNPVQENENIYTNIIVKFAFLHCLSLQLFKYNWRLILSVSDAPPWLQLSPGFMGKVEDKHFAPSPDCFMTQVSSVLRIKIMFVYAKPNPVNYRIWMDLEMINGRLMRMYKYSVHE